jgi:hypothetical protein
MLPFDECMLCLNIAPGCSHVRVAAFPRNDELSGGIEPRLRIVALQLPGIDRPLALLTALADPQFRRWCGLPEGRSVVRKR